MYRREVVAALGVSTGLIAGCLGSGDDEEPAEEDDPVDDTPDEWREAPDVDGLTADAGTDVQLEVDVHNHGTYQRPPVLSVTLTSTLGQSAEFGPFTGDHGPFNAQRAERTGGPPHVQLVGGAVIREAGCWAPETDSPGDSFVTLEPDDPVSWTIAVVPVPSMDDGPGAEPPACYRLGTYRVEAPLSIRADDTRETSLGLTFELV